MAKPDARTRFLLATGKARRTSRVHNLRGLPALDIQHLAKVSRGGVVLPRREMARVGVREHVLHRPSFAAPFRETAVEDSNIAMPHGPQHPPRARAGIDPGAVIDDDEVAISKAELPQ